MLQYKVLVLKILSTAPQIVWGVTIDPRIVDLVTSWKGVANFRDRHWLEA
jgi:hypothetical protein